MFCHFARFLLTSMQHLQNRGEKIKKYANASEKFHYIC